jgi:hypothetical protein
VTDYVKAWQCIGCGKIDAPQNCIGVCQDRRVEFVHAAEHQQVLAQLDAARRHLFAAASVLRSLASTRPHEDEWERSYRVVQQRARKVLTAIGREDLSLLRPINGSAAEL